MTKEPTIQIEDSDDGVFQEMVDLIEKSGIHDLPSFSVQAERRHRQDTSIFQIIHKMAYHSLWEAMAVAEMIQRNFLKTLKEKNESDKDLRYAIYIENNLEGDTYSWDSDCESLEFKHSNCDEDIDDLENKEYNNN